MDSETSYPEFPASISKNRLTRSSSPTVSKDTEIQQEVSHFCSQTELLHDQIDMLEAALASVVVPGPVAGSGNSKLSERGSALGSILSGGNSRLGLAIGRIIDLRSSLAI